MGWPVKGEPVIGIHIRHDDKGKEVGSGAKRNREPLPVYMYTRAADLIVQQTHITTFLVSSDDPAAVVAFRAHAKYKKPKFKSTVLAVPDRPLFHPQP
jgi:hypothetical protein